jgi:membrane protease YdiL (CAAX protease family)
VTASAVLIRPPPRAARVSLAAGTTTFAAALGGCEAAYRLAGALWGAVCFAALFLALVQVAALVGRRKGTRRELAALVIVASMVPLDRLLVLSVPTVSYLRLYPNALWVVPMGLTAVYAYRSRWLPGACPKLLPSPGWAPLAGQAAMVAAGAELGVFAASALPHASPHVLLHQDTAKWAGAALFALAGAVEELAWRGTLQRVAADAAGPLGAVACFAASAYVAVAWMGPGPAAPVIVFSGLATVVVYRTRCLGGAMAGHALLNLLLVMLR